MSLAEATALVGGGSGSRTTRHPAAAWQLEIHDPVADRLALEELATWCHRFSPVVGWDEATTADCLLLDVSGMGPLWGGEEALVDQVVQQVRNRGFSLRLAVADTVGAAWAVAHAGKLRCWPADQASPGLRRAAWAAIVPPDGTGPLLESLPLAALRLSEQTLELLARLGLRKIGQLLSLPRASLNSRLGPEVLRRLDQAWGHLAEPLAAWHRPPEFVQRWEFEVPIGRREPLMQASRELLVRLTAALSIRHEGALRLECGLQQADGTWQRQTLSLFRPSASAEHLAELLQLQWERVVMAAEIAALELQVVARAPLACQQQELFATGHALAVERDWADLIDRLASRLGRLAVIAPQLVRDAQPEFAWHGVPLADGLSAAESHLAARPAARRHEQARGPSVRGRKPALSQTAASPDCQAAAERPLWLWPEPVPIDVSMHPVTGRPVRLMLRGQGDLAVVRAWGPERIETGWWRYRLIRRDYYRVETATGARYWIFCQLPRQPSRRKPRWWCHGEFG